ncbi:MAG: glutamyl-tRNA reductase, partial [Halothiobacillaceae bacterium]
EGLISWLSDYHEMTDDTLRPYMYAHEDEAAIRHLMRVACGLDSLVLGEPQILGQIKTAFTTASEARTVGPTLNRLFQHAFQVAKQVRTDTAIGASPVSVAFAAVSLARQIFGAFGDKTALLVGAGETIELAARHLSAQGLQRVIVANRTVDRARTLADAFGGEAISLGEISAHLHRADIVISSTASPVPVLGKGAVESAIRKRKRRPMFMVDIAVPRDIEQEVGGMEDVYLYTVDDLESVIEEGQKSRQEAAGQAEKIIEKQVRQFVQWLRLQSGGETIRTFRESAYAQRDEVLARALAQLNRGKNPEQALQYLANTLTNQLIHGPTVRLREACAQGDAEALNALRQLLDIDGGA